MNDCSICKRHKDAARQSTVVYSDQHWVVQHSHDTNILGYFYIEARRHILDMSEANEEETATYGPLLKGLMQAIREIVEPKRIYTFSLSETVPHYHLHVIPRRQDFPRAYSGRGIMSYPTTPTADPALVVAMCEKVKRSLSRVSLRKC